MGLSLRKTDRQTAKAAPCKLALWSFTSRRQVEVARSSTWPMAFARWGHTLGTRLSQRLAPGPRVTAGLKQGHGRASSPLPRPCLPVSRGCLQPGVHPVPLNLSSAALSGFFGPCVPPFRTQLLLPRPAARPPSPALALACVNPQPRVWTSWPLIIHRPPAGSSTFYLLGVSHR